MVILFPRPTRYRLLPAELEPEILSFLYLPRDLSVMGQVSKAWRLISTRKLPFVRRVRDLQNCVQMLLEDRPSYAMPELGAEWEACYKWHWPSHDAPHDAPHDNYDSTPLWKMGDYVDALDRIGVWGSAIVVGCFFRTNLMDETQRMYRIRFLGWSDSFDEEVTPDKLIATVGVG